MSDEPDVRLRQSEERYRAFIEHSSEAIWRFELRQPVPVTLPPDEQIDAFYELAYLAECNDATARMYGYERADELTGLWLRDFLPRADPANIEYLRAFIASGYRLSDAESNEVDRFGQRRHFLNNLIGIVEDGWLKRAWGTQRDVTANRRAEEALREADRRKDEFLAMLAHELRNPLAPIRYAADLLERQGTGCPEGHRAIEIIKRQTQHLGRLVDDLLDVARITSGKIGLQREPVPLAEVIGRAVETCRPPIEERRHALAVWLPPGDLVVEGDPPRLVQVVANLLHNAAKYTDEGGHIWVEGRRAGAEAEIRVRDDGVGLSAELLPRVFDLFTQGDRSLDRAQGGLGIGLTLVRRLVELHGGRVEAHSEGLGRGSEFLVRLPALEATAVPGRAPARPPPAPRLRILLVEDNADAAEALRLLLELEGHDVRVAPDGPAALEATRRSRPDLVLCDIGLPGMDGYALAARLRERPDLGGVPLIALSGYGQQEDRARALAAGFDRHLIKPVEPDALRALLGSLSFAAPAAG